MGDPQGHHTFSLLSLCPFVVVENTLVWDRPGLQKQSPNDWVTLGRAPDVPGLSHTTCKVGVRAVVGGPTLVPLQERTRCEEWRWLTAPLVTPSGPVVEVMSGHSQPRIEHGAGSMVGHSCPPWDSSHSPSLLWGCHSLAETFSQLHLSPWPFLPRPPPPLQRCQTHILVCDLPRLLLCSSFYPP